MNILLALVVPLHHSTPGVGFDGGWIGPVAVAGLILLALAVVSRKPK